MSAQRIREPVIAGTWYPGDPGLLKKEIRKSLDRALPPVPEGELVGLVAPHAGYVFSGGVAAWAYKLLLTSRFERVLIIAPSHHEYFNWASVPDLEGYRTPLGIVPLDRGPIEDLYKFSALFRYNQNADEREHSIEIQLPFLQVVLENFALIPIIMGNQHYDFCVEIADAIAKTFGGRQILIIASSDLSHYYPYDKAVRLDRVCLDLLDDFDPEGLAEETSKQRTQACGAGPMIAMMIAARKLGADRCTVLNYANSGDVTGDRSGVVGYAAASVFRSGGESSDGTQKP